MINFMLANELDQKSQIEVEDSVVKSRDEKRIADSEIGEFNED